MPSPFPGMDPYLEGYLWPDVHHELASKIREQLTPKLRPKYVARIEIYTVIDNDPLAEVGIMYPDVEILRLQKASPTPAGSGPTGTALVAPPAPFELPLLTSVPVRVATVEIRDANQNELITSIEILSPVNKRGEGLNQYQQKRQKLISAGVHLLEIDLLRRGQRPLRQAVIPSSAYRITLIRALANKAEIWPLALAELLPLLSVPLRTPDDDIVLDLAQALQQVYEAGAYDLTIDYTVAPPPPPLSDEEKAWLTNCLKDAGLGVE